MEGGRVGVFLGNGKGARQFVSSCVVVMWCGVVGGGEEGELN